MADASKIIPHILQWEGGLSRNPADTASKNPAPCSYNGKTGYHTNKGVTYTTLQALQNR
jgi:lysozyme family protein